MSLERMRFLTPELRGSVPRNSKLFRLELRGIITPPPERLFRWWYNSFYPTPLCIVQTYRHVCLHTFIHTCIHTYIHTYIRTHIHSYIHTCNYQDKKPSDVISNLCLGIPLVVQEFPPTNKRIQPAGDACMMPA